MTKPEPLPELAGYQLVVPWPVQWGDQDSFQHVNNTIYFRWFETARIEYGRQIGLEDLFLRKKIGPILASIKCNFRQQVKYPDTVHIGSRITKIGRTSLTMEHTLYSEVQGAVAADGDSIIVVFDYNTHLPCPVPAEIRAAIERLEGRTF